MLKLLHQVEPAEKYKLRMLLGSGNQAERKTEDWLTGGIFTELRRRGLRYHSSVETIQRVAPRYMEDASSIQQFVRLRVKQETGNLPKQIELVGFGLELARVLAEYLKQVAPSAPLGLKRMLVNVSRMPEAIESSYPGYLDCGMLHCLIRGNGGKL